MHPTMAITRNDGEEPNDYQTLARLVVMLRLIPFAPQKISPRQLAEKLQQEGYTVHERTVQRDLKRLEPVFGLRVDDRSKPYGWHWPEGSRGLEIPGMEPSVALTFKLVQHLLRPLLPASALERLQRHFDRADRVLSQTTGSANDSTRLVYDLPRTQRLRPATIDSGVLQTVYDALLTRRRMEINYLPRGQEPRQYELNPLGLVNRDSVLYVVGTLWDYQHPMQFALHRMSSARLSDKRSTPLEHFELKAYVESGAFDFQQKGPVTLSLAALFDKDIAAHLHETPLADDQIIADHDDDRVLVTATVANTGQLRWWLLGFGPNVEVLKPESLRKEFKETTQGMWTLYRDK